MKDHVVIVTGSASGIGKSCANMLLDSGSFVMGWDLNPSTIENDKYRHYVVDVCDELNIIKAVAEIEKIHSKIDALVNCAGIFVFSKPFFDMKIDEWEKVISTNLTGIFLCSKHVSQKMIPHKKGKIVNISCMRSRIFRPNMAHYAASKGGVVALTSAMAVDLSSFSIRVNSVAPGHTYTGMTAKSFDNPDTRKLAEAAIPVGSVANPDDIAKVVLFLLSDSANYINGETIFVDGGYTIAK